MGLDEGTQRPGTDTAGAAGPASAAPEGEAADLGRELGGDLPCVVCGYNLRGLSIVAVCPECGSPVRATILAVVDPFAQELEPIRRPRLIAAATLAWTVGGLAAAVLCWLSMIAELVVQGSGRTSATPSLSLLVIVCLAASEVGAAVLIRPHAGIAWRDRVLAVVAVLAYVPLMLAMWRIGTHFRYLGGFWYLSHWPPPVERTLLRLGVDLLIIVIALCMRPNARALVARSLLLRSGRADRQTLLALAAAAAVAAAGDVLVLSMGPVSGVVGLAGRIAALVLIATGSLLLTIGLAGAVVDAARIGRSIVRPGPTLAELLRRRHMDGEGHA